MKAGLIAILWLATLLAALWAMTLGSAPLPVARVLTALWHGGAAREDLLVLTVRLPRVLAALGVGAALAAAGAMLQTVTRNPLAEPGLLGINGGAALAAVAVLVFAGSVSRAGLLGAAFLGAALAALTVHALGSMGRGGVTPLRLTLAGVVVGSFLTALTTALLIFDASTLDIVRVWTAGSLAGVRMAEVRAILPPLAAGLVVALFTRRQVAVMGFGEDVARGLGLDLRLWWPLVVGMVALLAGGSVALAGPVGFVGLIVPHAMRTVAGADYRRLLPLAMAAGAGLTVLADAAPRAIWGRDVPVGVSLAGLGGPLFLWLATRTKDRRA